ncbi:MAG: hypothetical protein FJ291_23660 [Planctomycetes bacterium]|nr:hypothetical protein [Planctomycetota bacterium]
MVNVHEGAGLRGVEKGEVKALRIVEMINRPMGTQHWAGMDGTPPMGLCSSWDAKRVVGTVPVSADGSATFTVPAGTAVYFQPLDANGRALQWMRSWATAQPGEVRACVGCHESKLAPPALRPAAAQSEPARPKPLWQALGETCFRCHSQPSAPPGVPEGGFVRFGKHKGRRFDWAAPGSYDTSNAVLINLTHPEQSRLLRAPLAKEAGGLGLHGEPPFKSARDPAYQAALAVIRSWAEELRRAPREDMPGATPCPEYAVWWQKRQESLAIEARSRENLARQHNRHGAGSE